MHDINMAEKTLLVLLKNEVFLDVHSLTDYWNVLTQNVCSSFPYELISPQDVINDFVVLDPPTAYQMNIVLSLAKVCNIVSNWNHSMTPKIDATPLQIILNYPELHKYRKLVSTKLKDGNANINYALACMSLLDKDPDNNLLIELLIAEYNAIHISMINSKTLFPIKEETDDDLVNEFMNCKQSTNKPPPQLVPKKIIRPKPRPFVFKDRTNQKTSVK